MESRLTSRVAPIALLVAFGLAAIALLTRGRAPLGTTPAGAEESEPALRNATDATERLVGAPDSAGSAWRTHGRAAGPIGAPAEAPGDAATLRVTVVTDAGGPLEHACVQVIGPTWRELRCDAAGSVELQLPEGEYEVVLPAGRTGERVAIYRPRGRSDARVELSSGETTEVELVAYDGATIEGQLVGSDGRTTRGEGVMLHAWNGERWDAPVFLRGDDLGRFAVDGLAAGEYALAPRPHTTLYFPPQRISLVRGERRTVSLAGQASREVVLGLATRSRRSHEPLPLWLQVSARRMGDEGSASLPGGGGPSAGKTLGPERVELRLFPGRYALDVSTSEQVESCTQIVAHAAWGFELSVEAGEDAIHESFELTLDGVGPLAWVTGRISGAKTEGSERSTYQVRFEHPAEGRKTRWIQPDPEGIFVLVVDLTLVQGGAVEFFEKRGSVATPLRSTRLRAGSQEVGL